MIQIRPTHGGKCMHDKYAGRKQCFGSILIESGSASSKALNPDPYPSYFFTLSAKKIKLLYYYKFLSSKEVNFKIVL